MPDMTTGPASAGGSAAEKPAAKAAKKKSSLPPFPEYARIPPNDPETVVVQEYDADGNHTGQSLHSVSEYDPETLPTIEPETNVGGFVQVDGHGWTDEQLEEKAASAAEGTEEEESTT